ncbi:MAG: molybdate ABC transporter substrate-binding protein [Planctomycetota bacterium]|nr:molybdate ABC transporter substrate-binding protein [Planctomycetota bacterium]
MTWRALVPLLLGLVQPSCSSGEVAPFTVGAAASATDALGEAVARWNASPEARRGARASFASSSTVARQMEAGAPFEIIVSADRSYIERLQEADLVDPASVAVLARNALVLAVREEDADLLAPLGSAPIRAGATLPSSLAGARWCTGDPEHVPAGSYAREALGALGWWGAVEPALVAVRDVRAAVRLVQLGEADLCVAYASDVHGRDLVSVPLDGALHRPVQLVAAAATDAGDEAREFLAVLSAPGAPAFGAAMGFLPFEGTR